MNIMNKFKLIPFKFIIFRIKQCLLGAIFLMILLNIVVNWPEQVKTIPIGSPFLNNARQLIPVIRQNVSVARNFVCECN